MKNLFVILFVTAALFAGCSKSQEQQQTPEQKQPVTEVKKDNSIIRSKDISVAEIDVNKDGKVFQCPMHAEVISDKQQPCPECGMDLDEVSVEQAQNNLK
jgi:uncharacterized protein YcfL